MRGLLLSLVVTTVLLFGCTETPKNYSCAFVDAPKIQNSLSIKNGAATLNTQIFPVVCFKAGNLTVYGSSKEDCKNHKDGGNYSIFIFDEVIYKASSSNMLNQSLLSSQYTCTKLN